MRNKHWRVFCNDMLKSGHLPHDLWLLVWASVSVLAWWLVAGGGGMMLMAGRERVHKG